MTQNRATLDLSHITESSVSIHLQVLGTVYELGVVAGLRIQKSCSEGQLRLAKVTETEHTHAFNFVHGLRANNHTALHCLL